MEMAIDSNRATRAGKKSLGKDTMSISVDKGIKDEFTRYCEDNQLKISPIVEDLIAQYLEEVKK